MSRYPYSPLLCCFVCTFVVLGAGPAWARRDGIETTDCSGCHGSTGADVQVSASPATFGPNDDVTFTVTIRRSDGAATVGGMFLVQPKVGALRELSGEGLVLEEGSGLLHMQPKAAQGGTVSFRFGWHAPSEPGGLLLEVAALAGNGDNRPAGDQAGFGRFAAAFGCTAATYYADLDRDGYGTEVFPTDIGCAGAPVPVGFSTVASDCDENDPEVHPSMPEKCNRKDDDCNGIVDDNSEPVELWPDADGDGYYGPRTGTPITGCVGIAGYAPMGGDCAPDDPDIHPGVTETCNGFDDNCDGREDERVRPQCGEGYCRRESSTCDSAECNPGSPRAELCNYVDDDCNGLIDDGATCSNGGSCVRGRCAPPGSGGTGAGAGAAAGETGGSSAGGSSSSGGAMVGGASSARPADNGDPPTALGCATVGARFRRAGNGGTLFALAGGLVALLAGARRRAVSGAGAGAGHDFRRAPRKR
jgi:hypothetical protein